ncbi:MAG: cell filamentation protein Fic, partial [Deltaproteobacteria bacterium]|nr:cell filamentation protein Fic [Deltaproteobacteria bacterium]
MIALAADRLTSVSIPVATGWLLAECMHAKGRQDLWTRRRPEVMLALREQAVIQSAESSNRI